MRQLRCSPHSCKTLKRGLHVVSNTETILFHSSRSQFAFTAANLIKCLYKNNLTSSASTAFCSCLKLNKHAPVHHIVSSFVFIPFVIFKICLSSTWPRDSYSPARVSYLYFRAFVASYLTAPMKFTFASVSCRDCCRPKSSTTA